MKANSIDRMSGVAASRQSDVVLRMNSMRQGLKRYGSVMVDLNSKTDLAAIDRLKKVHGAENVVVEKSSSAKLTIKGFK